MTDVFARPSGALLASKPTGVPVLDARVPLLLALVPDSEPKGTGNRMILVWLWI